MVHIKMLILVFAFHLGLAAPFICSAEDTVSEFGSKSEMVKRINERVDDFYRYRRDLDQRWEKRNGSASERKKREEAHARELEKAREAYLKSKAQAHDDEALRLKWEASQKDRATEKEMLRRRYVERKNEVEQYLKKGRQIPEMKEFDLEED